MSRKVQRVDYDYMKTCVHIESAPLHTISTYISNIACASNSWPEHPHRSRMQKGCRSRNAFVMSALTLTPAFAGIILKWSSPLGFVTTMGTKMFCVPTRCQLFSRDRSLREGGVKAIFGIFNLYTYYSKFHQRVCKKYLQTLGTITDSLTSGSILPANVTWWLGLS